MSRRTALVLCLTLCWLASARAATITVTSDSGGTGGPDCTLRDAITAANTDVATGGCAAGNGADTIRLPVDATILLTEIDNEIYGPNGLPAITSKVIINGNGSTVERDGADETPEFRILTVMADGGLTLENLTISNGLFETAPYSAKGGGIRNLGSLTLTRSSVTGNTADLGAGIHSTGSLILNNTTVSGNFGGDLGGGIYNNGVLIMNDSTLSNNEVSDFGGGILNQSSGTAMVTNSTISGNADSFHGAGIGNFGTMTIINTMVSGNVDTGQGGSGIWNLAGSLTLIDSTVKGNTASLAGGGGIFAAAGTVTVTGSTVCGNAPDQILGDYIDNGGNLVTDECPPCTAGELDGDGVVGAVDLAILLGSWGPCAACPADFDDDGQVGPLDLATLLAAWGPCP